MTCALKRKAIRFREPRSHVESRLVCTRGRIPAQGSTERAPGSCVCRTNPGVHCAAPARPVVRTRTLPVIPARPAGLQTPVPRRMKGRRASWPGLPRAPSLVRVQPDTLHTPLQACDSPQTLQLRCRSAPHEARGGRLLSACDVRVPRHDSEVALSPPASRVPGPPARQAVQAAGVDCTVQPW